MGGVWRLGGAGGGLGVEGTGTRGSVGLGIVSSTRSRIVGGMVMPGGGEDCAIKKLGAGEMIVVISESKVLLGKISLLWAKAKFSLQVAIAPIHLNNAVIRDRLMHTVKQNCKYSLQRTILPPRLTVHFKASLQLISEGRGTRGYLSRDEGI